MEEEISRICRESNDGNIPPICAVDTHEYMESYG